MTKQVRVSGDSEVSGGNLVLLLLAVLLFLVACEDEQADPRGESTVPSDTTATAEPLATQVPTATQTASPIVSPEPTATPTATAAPVPTATLTPEPTSTVTHTPRHSDRHSLTHNVLSHPLPPQRLPRFQPSLRDPLIHQCRRGHPAQLRHLRRLRFPIAQISTSVSSRRRTWPTSGGSGTDAGPRVSRK